MKTIKYFFIAIMGVLLLNSCSDDEIIIQKSKVTVNLTISEGIEVKEYKDLKAIFKEINTNEIIEKEITSKNVIVELNQGSYEVNVMGKIVYTFEGKTLEADVSAFENQVTFNKAIETKDIQLSLKSTQKDFVFGEIFFANTRTPEGQYYVDDDYFKIHNNTNEVLYADGLIIVMSKFQTTDKQDYQPNIMSEAFTADAMIQIPGNGTDYPIQPGESFVVANQAINHKENNANSYDLSKANFEFYYESLDDVDNPAVPNVINFRERMVVNQQGINSFIIFRLPKGMTKEQYLEDYKYDYSFLFSYGDFSLKMNESDYKVPNEWIIDAVNTSNEEEFQWLVTDPSLDKGWATLGYNAESRYGKSIQRKVVQEVNGKKLLLDTNDSTVDFKESTPSVSNY